MEVPGQRRAQGDDGVGSDRKVAEYGDGHDNIARDRTRDASMKISDWTRPHRCALDPIGNTFIQSWWSPVTRIVCQHQPYSHIVSRASTCYVVRIIQVQHELAPHLL